MCDALNEERNTARPQSRHGGTLRLISFCPMLQAGGAGVPSGGRGGQNVDPGEEDAVERWVSGLVPAKAVSRVGNLADQNREKPGIAWLGCVRLRKAATGIERQK